MNFSGKKIPIFCSLFVLGYGLGAIFPETCWGFNFFSFLPFVGKIGIGLITAVLMIGVIIPIKSEFNFFSHKQKHICLFSFLCAALMGLLFYAFPIAHDIYGDAHYIFQQVNITVQTWDSRLITELLSFHPLDPKMGTNTVYSLVNLISYVFEINGQKALVLLNVVFGMVFVFLWIRLVADNISSPLWQIIFWLAGMTAPFLLMFLGHYEVYAPAYPALLGYCMTVQQYVKNKKTSSLILCVGLFFICLKFHITSWLLVPSLLLLMADKMNAVAFFSLDHLTWKKLLLYVLVPIHLGGLLTYFFITKSAFGGRSYGIDTLEQVLFLPLKSSEAAPLDRYNLLSPEHFLDYFNMALFWSPVAIFLLCYAGVFLSKKINWNAPTLLVIGMTLIIYFTAFFVLNPLLAMPIDWDLFSLPAPILLFFTVMVFRNVKNPFPPGPVLPAVLLLALLSSTVFFIHANNDSLSKRLTAVGMWKFKTYWIGASTPLHVGAQLSEDPQKVRLHVLAKLKPFAVLGNDLEYADLLCEAGIFYVEKENDPERALPYFVEANQYAKELTRNIYRLVITHFMLGKFQDAQQHTRDLISVKYPSEKKAFRIGIHVALEANAYEDAQQYCSDYLKKWPEDDFILKVYNELLAGEELEKIKFYFRQE